MSWITDFIRPKLEAIVSPRKTADGLWKRCPGCGRMIYSAELKRLLRVCSACSFHLPMPIRERLPMFFDDGTYERITLPRVEEDPLHFRDQKRYSERLKTSRSSTGEEDAIAITRGPVEGRECVLAVLNFAFMGGSMGMAVGEGLVTAAELAKKEGMPLIVLTASGGARMQEGILSLMQLPRTVAAVEEFRAAGLPYIVILTHPTTGGVTASFAMLGDIALAEPGALIGFAGPRVIENTVGETLPDDFQKAEKVCELGMIDAVVHRHQMKDALARILGLLCDGKEDKASRRAPQPS